MVVSMASKGASMMATRAVAAVVCVAYIKELSVRLNLVNYLAWTSCPLSSWCYDDDAMAAERRKKTAARKGPKKVVSRRAKPDPAKEAATAPAPYQCSKCGFRDDFDEPDWLAPGLPCWKPRGKTIDQSYSICPDGEGPQACDLVDPERQLLRRRQPYRFGKQVVRACIPVMVLNRAGGRIVSGPVTEQDVVWRDIYRQSYLAEHGKDKQLDLRHAAEGPVGAGWRVARNDAGWAMPMAIGSDFTADEWTKRIRELQNTNDLAQQMNPFLIGAALLDDPENVDDVVNRTLHVPIDLARPIKSQLEDAHNQLRDIQQYLLGFAESGIRRDRRENLWRDVYTYMLRKTTKMKVREIAEQIFPDQEPDSAKFNIRQILRKVDLALKARSDSGHSRRE